MVSRLRASPRHGGQGVSGEYLSLIRRRGVPPGAAAFIIMENGFRALTDFQAPV